MSKQKQLRCYIELVVANQIYEKLNASATLKSRLAKQIKFQWRSLIKKIDYQILHNNREDEPQFAQNVLSSLATEKSLGMCILQNFVYPRLAAGGSKKSWAYVKEVLVALLTDKQIANWTLDDSSDHIRLLGTVVELIPTSSSVFTNLKGFAMLDEIKDSFRDQKAFSRNSRVRVRRDHTLTRDQHAKLVNDNFIEAAIENGWEDKYGPLNYWIKSQTFGEEVSGISGIELKQGSIVLAIDQAYMLPIGADISGTTADALFSLQVFSSEVIGNRRRLEPTVRNLLSPIAAKPSTWVYYGSDEQATTASIVDLGTIPMSILNLIPIATMVRQYHHTILEVAGTMSLYGTLHYQIGKYATLLGDTVMEQDEEDWLELYEEVGEVLSAIDKSIASDYPNFQNAYVKGLLGSGGSQ